MKLGHTGGDDIGFDGNKKVKGRKRHIVVDVLGLVRKCFVGAAKPAEVKAAPWVLMWVLEQYERSQKLLADKSDRGELGGDLEAVYGVPIALAQQESKGFQPEAKRWIVERTWAWLDNAHSLTRDDESLPENHAGMVYVVMIRLMLRRLGKNRSKWKDKTA